MQQLWQEEPLGNVEAPGGGSVHLVTHPQHEGHNRDNKDLAASSSTKAGDGEEEATNCRDSLPRSQVLDEDVEESHTRLSPSQLLNSPRTSTPSQSDWSGQQGCKYKS